MRPTMAALQVVGISVVAGAVAWSVTVPSVAVAIAGAICFVLGWLSENLDAKQ